MRIEKEIKSWKLALVPHHDVKGGFFATTIAEIELSDKEIQTITQAVAGWSYVARNAIINAMKDR